MSTVSNFEIDAEGNWKHPRCERQMGKPNYDLFGNLGLRLNFDGVRTYRSSCFKPNITNIPKGE